MLETVIDHGEGKALRVYNVHLSAKSKADRITQIHTIRSHIFNASKHGGARTGVGLPPLWAEDKNTPHMPDEFILLDDFNLSPQATEYHHHICADENQCDLVDCWMLGRSQIDEGITLPANTDIGQRLDFTWVDGR